MQNKSSLRTYTPEEKATAIQRAIQIGPTKAEEELGIPSGTLSCWVFTWRKANGVLAPGRSNVVTPTPAQVEPSQAQVEPPPQKLEPTPASPSAAMPPATAPAPPPRRVARLYTPSEKANALEKVAKVGICAASRELNITRYSLGEWRRRVEKAAAGQGDSPTSGPDPSDIEAKRDKEILDTWHQHPGLGPSQIRNQLRRAKIKVSTSTVRHVMEDAGYRPRKVERHLHDQLYEAVRPNHLWHLDFLCRHINRTATFSLILLDDFSRYVTGHGVDDAERADMVIHTFEEAVNRHGRPEQVMHDRGSAFWSWKGISRFTALLEEMGIDQVVAQEKETNGKIEVFNANLSKELFDVQRFYDLAEMKRRLTAHLHFYNHRRTHHALGGLLVPADRFYGRVEEVMARIEAGAGASIHTDLLDLRDRNLELFKVVSRDGHPEIWLLGQQLLPMIKK
jgi:transposase InsO family protein